MSNYILLTKLRSQPVPAKTKSARYVNGYRLVYKPKHKSAMRTANWRGYVYEHVVVAERMLKRKLSKHEVAHHLDGDRTNNRVTNLLVLLRSQHAKLHAWLANGALTSESSKMNRMNSVKTKKRKPIFCRVCDATLQYKQRQFCSKQCCDVGTRLLQRPSKTALASDVKNMSLLSVGRKYGVSDNAVRKWLRRYGLL